MVIAGAKRAGARPGSLLWKGRTEGNHKRKRWPVKRVVRPDRPPLRRCEGRVG